VGFTDGEGNFNIKITGLENNTYKSAMFTFQIGLHKDEIAILEFIKNTLNCGHISTSNNKVNFFVNDQKSLLNIIIPIFDHINLNSSKFFHYEIFKKAVLLTVNRDHLKSNGKLDIINFQKQLQSMSGK